MRSSRAQASLELFFSVSLFVLMLFWMNHFVGVASDAASSSRISAARSAAYSLAGTADAACLAQASVQVASPCLSVSEPLEVRVSGRSLSVGGVAVATRCVLADGRAVAYACGSPWCLSWASDGQVRLSEGGCA